MDTYSYNSCGKQDDKDNVVNAKIQRTTMMENLKHTRENLRGSRSIDR